MASLSSTSRHAVRDDYRLFVVRDQRSLLCNQYLARSAMLSKDPDSARIFRVLIVVPM
jgi:hypothetical protein